MKENIKTIVLMSFLAIFLGSACSAIIFKGVDFSIIKKTNQGNMKGIIEVRLKEKVAKATLKKLALKLKKDSSQAYDHLFITYYLPGMTSGAGAWATTHFNPELEVQILGTTIEEEEKLRKQTEPSSSVMFGEWLDESPFMGAKYTLFKKNSKTVMLIKFKDGSVSEKEMIQKKQGPLLRFEEKGGNSYGEYYLIKKDDNLGIYDGSGLIKLIKPIK